MRLRRTVLLAAAALAALLVPGAPVGRVSASTGTVSLAAGTLELTPPAAVSFSATLTGLDQTATATQSIDVGDATGSGAGWKLQATSTTFCTSGKAHCLPATATTIRAPGPSVACDTGSTCTVATNGVSYPYTLPAASTAPTATTFFDSAAGTGMGAQSVAVTFTVAIPANAHAGTYNSTWTYSLTSAP